MSMNPRCCLATLCTFPAPFCYLLPQKRASHASGNNAHLASHAVRPSRKVHNTPENTGPPSLRVTNKSLFGKVGLLIAYACMYK
ncbi:hypothetical protein E0H95_16855 [Pseudomonas syringae pv. tomato]|nr:hypothetical protein [Pseudomonas syringae pv. tomato]